MAGMLRVPRSRGAFSGFLLVLLGAWGALIPFIGPYFHYMYTPTSTWTYTTGRLWLEILPGAAAVLGGLIVMAASMRPVAAFGAWLAALGGAWFVIGPTVSMLWTANGTPAAGTAVGGTLTRAVEQIGFFAGLGVVVVFLAAFALGRFSVVGAREAALAEAEDREAEEWVAPARGPVAANGPEAYELPTSRAGADERVATGRRMPGRSLDE